MNDEHSQEGNMPSELREWLLSRANDIRNVEVAYDEILHYGERAMQKAEDDMNRQLDRGTSEREAIDAYKAALEQIKSDVCARTQELEDSLRKKYA